MKPLTQSPDVGLRKVTEKSQLNILIRDIALAVALGSAASLAAISLLAVSGWLIITASLRDSLAELGLAIVAVRALGIGRGLFRYVERVLTHHIVLTQMAKLRSQIFKKLSTASLRDIRPLESGDGLNRFMADIDAVQDRYIRGLIPYISAAVTSFITVIAIVAVLHTNFSYSAEKSTYSIISISGLIAAGLVLLISGVGIIIPLLDLAFGRKSLENGAPLKKAMTIRTVEAWQAADELAHFDSTQHELQQLKHLDDQLSRAEKRSAYVAGFSEAAVFFAVAATIAATLGIMLMARSEINIAAPAVAMIGLVVLGLTDVLASIPAAATKHISTKSQQSRVAEILNLPAEEASQGFKSINVFNDLASQNSSQASLIDPEVRRLYLKNIDVTWTPEIPDSVIIEDLTVSFTPGMTAVITGPSGVGKTTLLSALAGYAYLREHSGQEKSDFTAWTWCTDYRKLCAYCPQHDHVFSTSIRDNLLLAAASETQPVAEAEMWKALAIVNLDDFVQHLPKQLDTPLDFGSHTLSGGQRQRLAVARAICAQRQYILLDEPTAHVDEPTAEHIWQGLSDLARGNVFEGYRPGIIIVTHQPSARSFADQVISLAPKRDWANDSDW